MTADSVLDVERSPPASSAGNRLSSSRVVLKKRLCLKPGGAVSAMNAKLGLAPIAARSDRLTASRRRGEDGFIDACRNVNSGDLSVHCGHQVAASGEDGRVVADELRTRALRL